ncbi:MAG TPA: hypothetical protein GX692_04880 [Acholeplasmataceae bacterium]|nr:hypothetical protein [Acholeplasmataceae bacterium]
MEVPIDVLKRYQIELDGFSLQRILWLIDSSIRREQGYLSRFAIKSLEELQQKIIENIQER